MVIEYKSLITYQDLFSNSTDQFLKPFKNITEHKSSEGFSLEFEIIDKNRNKLINPIIDFATLEDAKAILKIYLEIYKGTYPYKEMENIIEIRAMIQSQNYRWLLFKDPINNSILGCFTYHLDFKNKRGYMRGFNIVPKYQKKVDAMKALIGSMIKIWSEFKDKILIWYSENRTAHTSSQYLAYMCGIKPIAILPNKDVFFDKIESDIMQIAYNLQALNMRRKDIMPQIIPEVVNCFNYSNQRYGLGKIKIKKKELRLDFKKIKNLKNNTSILLKKERFNYFNGNIKFTESDSHLKFIYNPLVNNIEKVKYKVNNAEELYILTSSLLYFILKMKVRYCEVIVSAYEPLYQRIFFHFGLKPRGYIPCWHYNSVLNVFEDTIVFNLFYGNLIDTNLIDQAKEFLKMI
ncbi:MAG: hypothetical protein JXA99_17650 [Candidatus Lokiarchaeota archaeon]|nr:hypothetical protein [Candidatus Lokiarchaeota archaeon]